MAKKKILVFIDWYLPGFKAGGPVQSVANLIANLSADFDFSVITRNTDYMESIPYSDIKSNCWVERDGVKIYYISDDQLNRSTIRELIRKTEFDEVYLNGIYSLYFTLLPLVFLRKKPEKKVVIAARGMLSEGSLGVKSTKKRFFLRAVKVIRLFDDVVFHATSESEKKDIHKAFGDNAQIRFASNLPAKQQLLAASKVKKEEGSLQVVSIARIAPEKNTLFALEILKGVKSKLVVDLYGPVYGGEYWEQCKRTIAQLPSNVTVNYKGVLPPDQVMNVLQEAQLFLLPSTGENFGHAIFQALAAGCPVLISDRTPWKQLETKKAGWEFGLDQPEQFTAQLEKVTAMSHLEWQQYSAGATSLANQYNTDQLHLEQNKSLFD